MNPLHILPMFVAIFSGTVVITTIMVVMMSQMMPDS